MYIYSIYLNNVATSRIFCIQTSRFKKKKISVHKNLINASRTEIKRVDKVSRTNKHSKLIELLNLEKYN